MSQNNPFCLSFGKEPDRYVKRADAYMRITDTFNSISPSSVQRDRLIKKGIIDGREYGTVGLLLPRFEEFVQANHYEE